MRVYASRERTETVSRPGRSTQVYVLDAATSKVAFRTGPGPLNGISKARALRDFLQANREF